MIDYSLENLVTIPHNAVDDEGKSGDPGTQIEVSFMKNSEAVSLVTRERKTATNAHF